MHISMECASFEILQKYFNLRQNIAQKVLKCVNKIVTLHKNLEFVQ
jgi:hypothetical protein